MKAMEIYIRSVWKTNLVYRWNFIIGVLANIFNVISMMFIWYVVYRNNGNHLIKGFDFNSLILYTIMSNLTVRMYNSEIEHTIADEVSSGQVVNNFIRPVSYFKRLIGETMGEISFTFLFLIFPVIFGLICYTLYSKTNFNVTYLSIFFYAITVIFSIILNFMLSFIIGLAAFYLNYIWGFFTLKSTIMALVTGQLFPLTFFPDKVVMILKLTPFYYMNFGPVSILLNQFSPYETYRLICIQILWCVILGILTHFALVISTKVFDSKWRVIWIHFYTISKYILLDLNIRLRYLVIL